MTPKAQPGPAAPGAVAPAGTVARAAAWLAKQVELGLAAVDLSLPQYRILGLLVEGSAVSSALADRLAVRPSSVTAVVDGLVSRGLVDRRQVVGDRRQVSHVLTAEGRRTLAAADRAVDDRLVALANVLPADLAERALDDLQLWIAAMSTRHAQATAPASASVSASAAPGAKASPNPAPATTAAGAPA